MRSPLTPVLTFDLRIGLCVTFPTFMLSTPFVVSDTPLTWPGSAGGAGELDGLGADDQGSTSSYAGMVELASGSMEVDANGDGRAR